MNAQLSLSYREDGSFKIVQFTDLHWGDDNANDRRTRALMDRVIERERPDLVVVTGDLIEAATCSDPRRSIRQAVAAMEEAGTPWAAVFGNHDAEAGVRREELFDELAGLKHGLMQRGPEEVTGVGNYVLRIAGGDGRTDRTLFFLDSGDYSPLSIGGYAAIARDQIDWFVRESAVLSAENEGWPVPALAFFHIPLPEYREVWERHECRGHKFEEVCCSLLNTGMFAAMAEAGNVAGTFVGHDHANDYAGELHGIRLCYGRKTGYNNYSKKGFPNGARVILLREGECGFRTWLRLDNGETVTEAPLHRPDRGTASQS